MFSYWCCAGMRLCLKVISQGETDTVWRRKICFQSLSGFWQLTLCCDVLAADVVLVSFSRFRVCIRCPLMLSLNPITCGYEWVKTLGLHVSCLQCNLNKMCIFGRFDHFRWFTTTSGVWKDVFIPFWPTNWYPNRAFGQRSMTYNSRQKPSKR